MHCERWIIPNLRDVMISDEKCKKGMSSSVF